MISAQIEKRQSERNDLESHLAYEKLIHLVLKYEELKFFFERFKNGDADDTAFRIALIDTFVNRIYVYDGENARIEIHCNASDININCAITEPLNSSSMAQLARPMRFERTTFRVGV